MITQHCYMKLITRTFCKGFSLTGVGKSTTGISPSDGNSSAGVHSSRKVKFTETEEWMGQAQAI